MINHRNLKISPQLSSNFARSLLIARFRFAGKTLVITELLRRSCSSERNSCSIR